VRDPRAQVVSMNRSIIYDFDISLNAARWADAQRAAERLAERYPTRVLTVRYEDFIADEAAIIARIADYLGLTFTPDMLAVSQSADAHKIAGMSDLWATNAKAPVAANVDKWRTQLSPADVEIIETLTGEYMDRYGYVRETAASAEVSEAQFADAERLSGDLCARAWSCLLENNSRDYLLRTLRANYLRMTRDKLQARLTCVA